MKLVTWNINSIRSRLHLIERLVATEDPDVVFLQETKVEDGKFPFAPLRAFGFAHIEIFGMKAYHGVAILSRVPLERPAALELPLHRRGHLRMVVAQHQRGVVVGAVEVAVAVHVPQPATVAALHRDRKRGEIVGALGEPAGGRMPVALEQLAGVRVALHVAFFEHAHRRHPITHPRCRVTRPGG